jgi:hypothetical protein
LAERGRRRLRMGLASSSPGGHGSLSAPTTWGCLRWLDEGRMKAGESRPDRGGPEAPCPSPEERSRGQKSPRWSAERRRAPQAGLRGPRETVWEGAPRQSPPRTEAGTKRLAPFGALPPRLRGLYDLRGFGPRSHHPKCFWDNRDGRSAGSRRAETLPRVPAQRWDGEGDDHAATTKREGDTTHGRSAGKGQGRTDHA